jgi:uncharacterized protein YndB with AHSA1/START domain
MKWVTLGVIVIGAIAGIAALIGSRLPRSHHASAERILPVAPEPLWRTLTDVDAFPAWRRDVKRVTRLADRDGKPMWIEDAKSGKVTFAFERMDAPKVLVSRIADPNLPFGGTWTFEIAPAAHGSRLRISEDGEIYNPLFRFMARFIFGYEGTINEYLATLEAKFHGV